MMLRRVLVAIAVASVADVLAEESMATLARRERERQRGTAKPVKVYTEEDLRQGRRVPSADPSPATPVTNETNATASDDKEDRNRQALEQQWRARFDDARQKIKDAERRAWRTVIRPVVVGGSASGMVAGKAVIVPMEVREFQETEELRAARRALGDLEEELRRTGLPPGWGRER